MKLIAGLGNPGSRYAGTRHNAGFLLAELLSEKYKAVFKKKLFFNARQCAFNISDTAVILVEPLSFMNLSGGVVRRYAGRLGIDPGDILVVYDDIDIPLGSFKIRLKGSAGGHNGMESVMQCMGTDEIARLRIGINSGFKPGDLSEYVLSVFEKNELTRLRQGLDGAISECERWVIGKI
ncbi:MAG: aminoacyl-tRNA hydrolase [Candidatus Omnitrophica bacterium]|jgi:PTH1 family peptidyl-tRNA hydrolase|nr:aminoacyl-tRNA hydrolase [Candidatus Omnitrophota bacterium]